MIISFLGISACFSGENLLLYIPIYIHPKSNPSTCRPAPHKLNSWHKPQTQPTQTQRPNVVSIYHSRNPEQQSIHKFVPNVFQTASPKEAETPENEGIRPLKRDQFKRKDIIVFQPSFLRGDLLVLGGSNSNLIWIHKSHTSAEPGTLNNNFFMDVWWNNHFPSKGLESSNWNNHFKVDVSGTRCIKQTIRRKPTLQWLYLVLCHPFPIEKICS